MSTRAWVVLLFLANFFFVCAPSLHINGVEVEGIPKIKFPYVWQLDGKMFGTTAALEDYLRSQHPGGTSNVNVVTANLFDIDRTQSGGAKRRRLEKQKAKTLVSLEDEIEDDFSDDEISSSMVIKARETLEQLQKRKDKREAKQNKKSSPAKLTGAKLAELGCRSASMSEKLAQKLQIKFNKQRDGWSITNEPPDADSDEDASKQTNSVSLVRRLQWDGTAQTNIAPSTVVGTGTAQTNFASSTGAGNLGPKTGATGFAGTHPYMNGNFGNNMAISGFHGYGFGNYAPGAAPVLLDGALLGQGRHCDRLWAWEFCQ